MPSERTVRCRQWGPVPGDGAMSRWNGFRRNTMLGFHSRKSIVFDCGAPGAPQSRRPGCNAASAAAPKTRREELSRIASVNLKKASSGCRSAVSSRVLAFCVMVVCLVATLGVTAANLRLTYVTDSNGAKQVILTSATDPAKVMSLSGIQSEEGDQVYYTAFSGNLATLNIERAFSVNIQADGQTYPVKMVYGTVADALQRPAAHRVPHPDPRPPVCRTASAWMGRRRFLPRGPPEGRRSRPCGRHSSAQSPRRSSRRTHPAPAGSAWRPRRCGPCRQSSGTGWASRRLPAPGTAP